MEKLYKKIKRILKISVFKTIFFNFYYLPFRQAIKFPVFLYNIKISYLGGRVYIKSEKIKPGLIQLGFCGVPIFNEAKFVWRNKGTVIFNGFTYIGNNSGICCYPGATLSFGSNFVATNNIKIECFKSIQFGANNRFAWECIIMDSSQHRIKNENGEYVGSDASEIQTGRNCWIASRCMLLKGAKLPNYCIVAAGTTITKDFSSYPERSLIAIDSKVVVKKTGIWRDPEDPRDLIATELWYKKM